MEDQMDYKSSGVDIEAGYNSVELMKQYVKTPMRPEVLGGLGGFSGAFSLEKIKDMNQFPEDQGLASLGLAMVMKESSGMQQDDSRLVAARGRLLKDAIIKCYDAKFGPVPVQDLVKEELYEILNLNIGQTGPKIKLPSSATGTWVEIPSGDKPVLLVFWDPRDAMSVKFLEKAASLR